MKIHKFLLFLAMAQAVVLFSLSSALSQGQITMAGLEGRWGFGNSLILTYLDLGTGDYSHFGNIFGMTYTVKHDGSFYYAFAAKYGNRTVLGSGLGTVIIARDLITFKFDQGAAEKYKFVALETGSSGEPVLTLMQINDPAQQRKCGHSIGYFDCTGRQEWTIRRYKR